MPPVRLTGHESEIQRITADIEKLKQHLLATSTIEGGRTSIGRLEARIDDLAAARTAQSEHLKEVDDCMRAQAEEWLTKSARLQHQIDECASSLKELHGGKGAHAVTTADLVPLRKKIDVVDQARLADRARHEGKLTSLEEKHWADVQAIEERIALLEELKHSIRSNNSQMERDNLEMQQRVATVEVSTAKHATKLGRLDVKIAALERNEGHRITEAKRAAQRTDKLAALASELASLATDADQSPSSTPKSVASFKIPR